MRELWFYYKGVLRIVLFMVLFRWLAMFRCDSLNDENFIACEAAVYGC